MVCHSLKALLKAGRYFIALPIIPIPDGKVDQDASDAIAVAELYAAAVLGIWQRESMVCDVRQLVVPY